MRNRRTPAVARGVISITPVFRAHRHRFRPAPTLSRKGRERLPLSTASPFSLLSLSSVVCQDRQRQPILRVRIPPACQFLRTKEKPFIPTVLPQEGVPTGGTAAVSFFSHPWLSSPLLPSVLYRSSVPPSLFAQGGTRYRMKAILRPSSSSSWHSSTSATTRHSAAAAPFQWAPESFQLCSPQGYGRKHTKNCVLSRQHHQPGSCRISCGGTALQGAAQPTRKAPAVTTHPPPLPSCCQAQRGAP